MQSRTRPPRGLDFLIDSPWSYSGQGEWHGGSEVGLYKLCNAASLPAGPLTPPLPPSPCRNVSQSIIGGPSSLHPSRIVSRLIVVPVTKVFQAELDAVHRAGNAQGPKPELYKPAQAPAGPWGMATTGRPAPKGALSNPASEQALTDARESEQRVLWQTVKTSSPL